MVSGVTVCIDCGQRMHGDVSSCLKCDGTIKPWTPTKIVRTPFDRARFLARRAVCRNCKHHGNHIRSGNLAEGCGKLEKPCDVEKLWMSGKTDWCPIGCEEQVELYLPANTKKVVPPSSWHHDITPSSDYAVVTFAIGRSATEIAAHTLPGLERYAERCGADFHCFTDDQFKSFPIGNKFRLSDIGKRYKKTVYLDIDTWVEPTTPSLFELSSDRVWWFSEKEWWKPKQNWWHPQDVAMLEESQQVTVNRNLDIRNTGVVVFSRWHSPMWEKPAKFFLQSHTAEQTWVEIQSANLGYKFGRLPMRYNLQVWMRRLWGKQQAHIYHLAGSPHDYRMKWLTERSAGKIAEEIRIPIDWPEP